MPVFVRSGSIVPLGPFLQYAAEKAADFIELQIYTGKDGSFILYEDENDNYNYEKGVFSTISFKWNDANRTLEIGQRTGAFPGMPEKRIFAVVLVRSDKGIGLEI